MLGAVRISDLFEVRQVSVVFVTSDFEQFFLRSS
jgi:hypothetical protein